MCSSVGVALHPLALGNVLTIRRMLNEHVHLKEIAIIGVGGVSDSAGFERMLAVGASAVGVGTAFGRHGISVFRKIRCNILTDPNDPTDN